MIKWGGERGTETLMQAIQRDLQALLSTADEGAICLPPAAYFSAEVLELETLAIFEREWICLGRTEQVANPGDYFTTELVGDPLLVVRDEDHRIRVLSNVCRHKWTQVATGEGNTNRFVCPYHAWTYGLDGRLLAARFMERSTEFDLGRCALPELRSEIWHGFIYVNLDPDSTSLASRLEALEPMVANYHMEEMTYFTGGDEIWETNWKLLTENFTEAYHTFPTHAQTLDLAMPSELTEFAACDDQFSTFYSRFKPEEPARAPCHPSLTDEQRRAVYMICLFPSHVIALAPERVFYMCLTPLAPDRVRTRWGVASYAEALVNDTLDDLKQFYRQVNAEDQVRLESIQKGVRARHAGRGPLSWLERTNWHLSQYVARKLVGLNA